MRKKMKNEKELLNILYERPWGIRNEKLMKIPDYDLCWERCWILSEFEEAIITLHKSYPYGNRIWA